MVRGVERGKGDQDGINRRTAGRREKRGDRRRGPAQEQGGQRLGASGWRNFGYIGRVSAGVRYRL